MKTCKPFRRRQAERGSMLIELLISMSILVVGLGALMILLVSSVYTDSRSRNDTTSTMVAEHVLEQISAQPANGTLLLQLVDCANTTWNMDTSGSVQGAGTGGSYGGNGANLTSIGTVDWTQNYSSIPNNYGMQYVSCGTGGKRTAYDVRWNVITITNYSRMVVVSARPTGSATVSGLRYVVPAQLRTIAGM
jgi:type II secretory pathway pseudopilin PulG